MFLNDTIARGGARIALADIEAAVAERIGPGRVPGNAQPAAFSRQIAMYIASQVGGWSTTKIGKFYNGRHHTTVCYAIERIKTLRDANPQVDSLLTMLTDDIRDRTARKAKPGAVLSGIAQSRLLDSLVDGPVLDAIAERIASRVVAQLTMAQPTTAAGPSRT